MEGKNKDLHEIVSEYYGKIWDEVENSFGDDLYEVKVVVQLRDGSMMVQSWKDRNKYLSE